MPATSNNRVTEPVFQFARRMQRLKPSAIREILKTTQSAEVISLAGGLPAPELFPVDEFARACREVWADDPAGALQYGVTEGYPPLREWVCEHLERTVSLKTSPDRVLITSGSQQGLDLVARTLLDPGDTVVLGNPAYLGALHAFEACEARAVGVACDEHGLLPDALRDTLRRLRKRTRLLYLVPNFHNPTGVTMPRARRLEVAEVARQAGIPVLEDDPYGRLRYGGEFQPALATLDPSNCLYLGTSSKIMAPGLRVAWLVAPDRETYDKLVTTKQATDLHTSTLTQRLVWHYARENDRLEAHVQRLVDTYARRRDAMLSALENVLPDGCSWTRPEGGLFVWVCLPEQVDTMELLRAAATRQVVFVPGEPFWVDTVHRNTLRLNFSNASEERIEEGVRRLGEVIDERLRHSDS